MRHTQRPARPWRGALLALAACACACGAAAAAGPDAQPGAPAVVTADSLAAAAAEPDTAAAAEPADAGAAVAPADSTRARFGRRNVPAWPIYFSWDWESGDSLRVFGPVTALHRSPGHRSFYPAFPVVGARRWDDGRRALHLAWPLVYTQSDPGRGTWSVNLATPLFSVRSMRGPGYRDLSFLPLYHAQRTPSGKRTHMVAPIRRRVQEPLGHRLDETWGFVPIGSEPLAWLWRRWRNEHGQGWNSAWLYGGAAFDDHRFLHLPPYVGFTRRLVDGGERRFDLFAPFYVADRTPVSRYRAVLPLYVGARWPGRELHAGLPSWWSYRSPGLASRGLWPLYASFERTWADSVERRGASFAWPLVTWGRGDDFSTLGILPFYFTLRDGPRRVTAVPPVYFALSDSAKRFVAAPPLYWHSRDRDRETRVFAPFHGTVRTPDSYASLTLNWYRHEKPGYSLTGLFPVWERLRAAKASHDLVFPLWYHSWSARHDTRFVAPAWAEWRSKTDGSVTRLAGPVLTTRGPGTSGFGILPVFYSTRGPGSRRTLLGPLFTSRDSGDVRHTVLAPLAWHRSSPAGWAIDLLPFTGYRSGTDGRRLLYVLGPAYVRRVDGPRQRTDALLGWLYRDERRGEKRRSMLQPLYFYERRAQDDVFFSMLGGLLGSYERAGRWRQLKVLFVPVRRWEK